MKLGFTGTRNGMTTQQYRSFVGLLVDLAPAALHHGACVGADTQAAKFARLMSHAPVFVVAHPGKSAFGGANEYLSQEALDASVEVRTATTHFARNRCIVNETERLVATPWQSFRPPPKSGGGTWMTIEHAEKVGKPVHIVWPDGSVTHVGVEAPQ